MRGEEEKRQGRLLRKKTRAAKVIQKTIRTSTFVHRRCIPNDLCVSISHR
jgi:hypothetical protein